MKRVTLLSILLCALMSWQSVTYAQSSKTNAAKHASTTSVRTNSPVDVLVKFFGNATSTISKCTTLYEAQNAISNLDYSQLNFTDKDLDHRLTDSEKTKLSNAISDFCSTAARSLGAPESNAEALAENADSVIKNGTTIRQVFLALNMDLTPYAN